MTRVCCPSCQLRFTPAAAAFLTTCPECGDPLEAASTAQDAIGFRLFVPEDQPALPPAAHGSAAATLMPHRPGPSDWNIRLLQAAVRRARDSHSGRPHGDA
jgi:hypothetical protein